jgi:hypothetical protein
VGGRVHWPSRPHLLWSSGLQFFLPNKKKKDVLWYKATPIHQPAKSLQRKGTKVDLGRSQKYYIWRDGWGDKKQASTKAAPSAPSFRPNGMTSTVKKS